MKKKPKKARAKEAKISFGGRKPVIDAETRKWLDRPGKKTKWESDTYVTCFEERKGWPSAPFQAKFIKKEGNMIQASLKGHPFQLNAALCSMEQQKEDEGNEEFLKRARLSLPKQVGAPFDPITGARL